MVLIKLPKFQAEAGSPGLDDSGTGLGFSELGLSNSLSAISTSAEDLGESDGSGSSEKIELKKFMRLMGE
ncbi:hypothetical protein V2J09_023140 [Rumex salicifolius]